MVANLINGLWPVTLHWRKRASGRSECSKRLSAVIRLKATRIAYEIALSSSSAFSYNLAPHLKAWLWEEAISKRAKFKGE